MVAGSMTRPSWIWRMPHPTGRFIRSIIKVTEPEKYLINVSDYFT